MDFGGHSTRPTRGLSVRNGGRMPLGDLASANNRAQRSNFPDGPVKPQMFTVFREPSGSVVNDENRPPVKSQHNSQKQHQQHQQQQAKQFVWPAGQNNQLNFVIHQDERPQAASSPASVATRSSRLNDNVSDDTSEERTLAASADSVHFSLYSASSASEFRRNNDSISSTTTNEDDCDVFDDVDNADDNVVAAADEDFEILEVSQDSREPVLNIDDYALDIMKQMIARESNFMPKWNYMTKQPDITFTMRSILIDWLIEVGEEYKLNTETLFLAVNYIDRFLSFMSVQRAKLQLVGTACMFIAAKYEEIYPPDVSEFCYITDGTYTKRQVLRMEQLVLGVLNFECAPPTAHFFVNHMAGLAGCGDESRALAQYLAELTLMDAASFLPFSPSVIGAASVALARHTLGLAAWEESMVARTGYAVEDFRECLVRLHATFTKAPELQQQAIREKYRNAKYHSVSEVQPTPIF